MEEIASLSVNEDENDEETVIKIKQENKEQLETRDVTSTPRSVSKSVLDMI
jgi:hypothetical protein